MGIPAAGDADVLCQITASGLGSFLVRLLVFKLSLLFSFSLSSSLRRERVVIARVISRDMDQNSPSRSHSALPAEVIHLRDPFLTRFLCHHFVARFRPVFFFYFSVFDCLRVFLYFFQSWPLPSSSSSSSSTISGITKTDHPPVFFYFLFLSRSSHTLRSYPPSYIHPSPLLLDRDRARLAGP